MLHASLSPYPETNRNSKAPRRNPNVRRNKGRSGGNPWLSSGVICIVFALSYTGCFRQTIGIRYVPNENYDNDMNVLLSHSPWKLQLNIAMVAPTDP